MYSATPPLTPLCELCAAIFNVKNPTLCFMSDKDTISLEWHPNLKSFRQSAATNCRLCVELWQEVMVIKEGEWAQDCVSDSLTRFVVFIRPRVHSRHKPLDASYKFLIEFASITLGQKLELQADISFGQHWVQQTHGDPVSQIDLVAGKDQCAREFQRSSPQNLSSAVTWLEGCLRDHESCRTANVSLALPLRLIHLAGQGSNLQARLVERDEIPRGCKYLTLSHCWGNGPIYSLRSGLLALFKQDIPISQLPKTFRDAFDVTVRLGYSYIWIDSLTILQDIANDWEQEASRMADVYENAVCNIAATGFTSSDTGLFARTSLVSPIRTVPVDMQLPGWSVRGDCSLIQTSYWTTRVTKAPLNKRAWVLQEWFFSPRVLHFGHDQLLWDCQELRACELAPRGLPPTIRTFERAGYRLYRYIMDLDMAPRLSSMRKTWYNILTEYTNCALTFPSDRLVAISGITRRFEKILDDVCTAGLWQKSLAKDILWCRAWLDHRELARNSEWRAPTWSWACLDCSIFYNEPSKASRIVASVSLAATSSDSSRYHDKLRVQAPLLKAHCRPDDIGKAGRHLLTFTLRGRLVLARVKFDGRRTDFEGDNTTLQVEGPTTETTVALQPGTMWIHLVVVVSKASTAGLLLKRSARAGDYSRIGYFDTFVDPDSREVDDLQELDDCLQASYAINRDDYIDSHGGGVYSFNII